MKIYLDLVFFLNFAFDFILLFAVSRILKEKVKLYRLVLGSLIGSFSIFLLFFSMNSGTLFLWKVLISILMIRICFSYHHFRSFLKQVAYLYLVSIILGGGLYLVNIQLSYKQKGLVFFHQGLGINFLFILILAPLILFFYGKEYISYRRVYSNICEVEVIVQGKTYCLKGYLDTGNQLRDPFKKRSVLLVDQKKMPLLNEKVIYVPFQSLNHHGVVPCFSVENVKIKGKSYPDMLIGLSKEKFHIEDIDCIIPGFIKEDIHD